MANLPNRTEYGHLACLWGVFKSRYTHAGDSIKLSDLKHSDSFPENAVDICAGRQPFPTHIARQIGRNYYCPFLQSRTDARMCQWVHAKNHDPQKSKPVGQTAIIMDILGLADLSTTKTGIVKKLSWTTDAELLSELELKWGDSDLNQYFEERILAFGPIVALIFYLSNIKKTTLKNSELYDKIKIIPTGEPVLVTCAKGTISCVSCWDGNISNDAAIRSTSCLLTLLATVGVVKPIGYPDSSDLNPTEYSKWIIERAKNNIKILPKQWEIEKPRVSNLISNGLTVKKGISYLNFIPKPTDRNIGNRCTCCNENVINNARRTYGTKSRNRKLLLIEALKKARKSNSMVDLKRLAEVSLQDEDFFLCKDTQYETLLNIERINIALYGFPNTINGQFLMPISDCSKDAFDGVPADLMHKTMHLLNADKILLDIDI